MAEMAFREPFRTLLDGHPTPREVTVARSTLADLRELTPEMLESLERNVANRLVYGSPSEAKTVLANANCHVILRGEVHE